MALGYLLCGAGFALNALARTVTALVGCMIIFTLGEIVTMPMASAYLADLAPPQMRSEEHTSELQSRENLVCRLLLEKKNTNTSTIPAMRLPPGCPRLPDRALLARLFTTHVQGPVSRRRPVRW